MLPATSKRAVGVRLELTRAALEIDQGVFANHAGINGNTYNQYEKGERLPVVENAIKLCSRYELTLDWVYRGDPSGLKYGLADKINRLRQKRNSTSRK